MAFYKSETFEFLVPTLDGDFMFYNEEDGFIVFISIFHLLYLQPIKYEEIDDIL